MLYGCIEPRISIDNSGWLPYTHYCLTILQHIALSRLDGMGLQYAKEFPIES